VSLSRLARLLGFGPRSAPAAAAPLYRPCLEALEDRLVPSGGKRPFFTHEPDSAAEDATDGLNVISYNVDQGSRLAPLLAASSPQELPAAMSQVWAEVQASDIPGRAMVIAREIARADPDVVGLQEAAVWTVNGVPRFDFLGLLARDLRARGEHFRVASVEAVTVLQLPDAAGNVIGLVDQTAVLVNREMGGRSFVTARPARGTFAAERTVQVGGPQGPVLAFPGTWASVDLVDTDNFFHTFRYVSVHLDGVDPAVNAAQAAELAAGPGRTGMGEVLAGDFGFPADQSPPYAAALQSVFIDAWLRHHASNTGPTAVEPDLRDARRTLQARTDAIFYITGVDMSDVNAWLLGFRRDDRTAGGLLPSDHAGLHDFLLLS
jgi:endonuclease/exonuclease/phosphatase family metal-dependent hydrolase